MGTKSVSGKDCRLNWNTWSYLESVENNVWILNKHFPVNITFDEFRTKRPHRHSDECDTDNNFEYVQIAQRWKVCGIHSEWSYFSKKHTLEIKILAKAQSHTLQSVLRVSFSFQAIEGIQTCIPIQRFPNMYFVKPSKHFRAKLQIYSTIKSTKVGIYTVFIQAEKHNHIEKMVFHHKNHGVPKTQADFETHFYDGPGPLCETLKIKRKYLNETLISDTVYPTTFQSFVSITTDSASDTLFVNITFQSSMKHCINITVNSRQKLAIQVNFDSAFIKCYKVNAFHSKYINITWVSFFLRGPDTFCSFGGIALFEEPGEALLSFCDKATTDYELPGRQFPFTFVSSNNTLIVAFYNYPPYSMFRISIMLESTHCTGMLVFQQKKLQTVPNVKVVAHNVNNNNSYRSDIFLGEVACLSYLHFIEDTTIWRATELQIRTERMDSLLLLNFIMFFDSHVIRRQLGKAKITLAEPYKSSRGKGFQVFQKGNFVNPAPLTKRKLHNRAQIQLQAPYNWNAYIIGKGQVKHFTITVYTNPTDTFWVLATVEKSLCSVESFTNFSVQKLKMVQATLDICLVDVIHLVDVFLPWSWYQGAGYYHTLNPPDVRLQIAKKTTIHVVGSCFSDNCKLGEQLGNIVARTVINNQDSINLFPLCLSCRPIVFFTNYKTFELRLSFHDKLTNTSFKRALKTSFVVKFERTIHPPLFSNQSIHTEPTLTKLNSTKLLSWSQTMSECREQNATLLMLENMFSMHLFEKIIHQLSEDFHPLGLNQKVSLNLQTRQKILLNLLY